MLGIKHYWVRYEFAKGRGQIHAHLLAITEDGHNSCLVSGEPHSERVTRVETWAKEKFGLTACHPASSADGLLDMSKVAEPEGRKPPNTASMSTRAIDKDNLKDDITDLCNCTQMHKCSAYCMRQSRKRKNPSAVDPNNEANGQNHSRNKRFCRFGCGDELIDGSYRTPGFPLSNQASITNDKRGFNKLELTRNTVRMTQSSTSLLQAWRGNCDLQVILYDSPFDNFDFTEIARVTDYVVAYACKGNNTLQVEKDNIKTVIMKYVSTVYICYMSLPLSPTNTNSFLIPPY